MYGSKTAGRVQHYDVIVDGVSWQLWKAEGEVGTVD
jgi:hypothetical protein